MARAAPRRFREAAGGSPAFDTGIAHQARSYDYLQIVGRKP